MLSLAHVSRIAGQALASPARHFATRALSAYAHFTKQAFQSKQITRLESKKRMGATAAIWRAMSEAEKENWKKYAEACKDNSLVSVSPVQKQAKKAGKAKSVKAPPKTPKKKSSPPRSPSTAAVVAAKKPKAKKRPSAASSAQKTRLQEKVKALKTQLAEKTRKRKRVSSYQAFQSFCCKAPEIRALSSEKRFSAIAERWRKLTAEEKEAFQVEAAKASPPAAKRRVKQSAYQVFIKSAYQQANVQSLPFDKRLGEIAKMWKQLSAEQKKPFVEEAAKTKAGHPKKASGYILFQKEVYASKEVQSLPLSQRFGAVAKQWKDLSETQRKAYSELAKQKNKPAVPSETSAASPSSPPHQSETPEKGDKSSPAVV